MAWLANPYWVLVVGVTFVLPGCLDEVAAGLSAAAEETVEGLVEANVHALPLEGHMIAGPVGELSHTRETEQLLWDFQQVGWRVELAEPLHHLEFAVVWEGEGAFKFESHSHNHETMQCCVIHETPENSETVKCVRIPIEDAAPGEWEPMVRSTDVYGADFTLYVITVGAPPRLLSERHGHDRIDETPLGSGRSNEHRVVEPCILFDQDLTENL